MTSDIKTSATGGYLVPVGDVTIGDDELARAIQRLVVGITGLAGKMVRPRYQANPAAVPENTEDWCAVGVLDTEPSSMPEQLHDPLANGGLGRTTLRTFDEVTVMASFYGPRGMGYASRLRDGLFIAQNREAMGVEGGLNVISAGTIRQASDIQNTTFRSRFDFTFILRHRIEREYDIQNVVEVRGVIHAGGEENSGAYDSDLPFTVKE